PRPQHALVRDRRTDLEELPDRPPAPLQVVHRPLPQLVISLGLDPAPGQPTGIPRQGGALDPSLFGSPEDGWDRVHVRSVRGSVARTRKRPGARGARVRAPSASTRQPAMTTFVAWGPFWPC